ncbi:MAG: protein phosphatase CheZ [Rhodothermaceae bacterium]
MTKNMSEIFTKLNDLKNIFQFAEKIVPIIQSLIEFMQEMTPMLENINLSIEDSTNQMKQGTDRIENVTSATELATTEILDKVDEISNKLMAIEGCSKEISDKIGKKKALIQKLKEMLTGNDDALAIIDEFMEFDESSKFETIFSELGNINDDIFNITLSLQVQDITAQQLASVNHLISSVQGRLNSLINQIDKTNINEQVQVLQDEKTGIVFDPNASYTDKEGKQNKVDEIIDNQNQNQNVSQDDVDSLIDDSKKSASQDEIDKLFS